MTDEPASEPSTESGESFDTGSIVDALGGPRGLVESTVPGVVFATIFAFTSPSFYPALWTAVGVAVAILILALVQRRSVQQTLAGFIGIALTAGIVLITGRARDFFLVGLYRNAVWLAAHAISGLVGWPLIGLFLGPFTGEGVQWRKDPARFRAYQWCGLVWVAVFAIRLGVQLPLFRGDHVVALGFAQIVLGLPLFLAACFANFLILRRVPITLRSEPEPEDGQDHTPHPPPISPG
jgi:hypothetical protein